MKEKYSNTSFTLSVDDDNQRAESLNHNRFIKLQELYKTCRLKGINPDKLSKAIALINIRYPIGKNKIVDNKPLQEILDDRIKILYRNDKGDMDVFEKVVELIEDGGDEAAEQKNVTVWMSKINLASIKAAFGLIQLYEGASQPVFTDDYYTPRNTVQLRQSLYSTLQKYRHDTKFILTILNIK